ncbi:hypothetical protein SAY87_010148 [Trapa incisa]|uniref:BHLH domain-containing protein n=1 Tax=Trapa incisa TaxID=236973 RepID=A0AAN7GHB7_9MYRT|nr:hypothetical protein SAY87_010148 [Trapa incisa]
MVLGPNGVHDDGDSISWARNPDTAAEEADNPVPKQDDIPMSMPFWSMFDSDSASATAAPWYFNPQLPPPQHQHSFQELSVISSLHQQSSLEFHHNLAFLDASSSTCSPNQPPFLGFDLAAEASFHFLPTFPVPNLLPNSDSNPDATENIALADVCTGLLGFFEGFDRSPNLNSPMFLNHPKAMRPLEVLPQMEAQPTLFQKRAARLSISGGPEAGEYNNKRKRIEEDDIDEIIGDDVASEFNYESDEGTDHILNGAGIKFAVAGGDSSRMNETSVGNNSTVTEGGGRGDQKGKKKRLPAKNLMAERRRREKLNDRLYMLRSVVPKISKMDRASILRDAIDYLKDLLQRINDLHNELESMTPRTFTPSTNFQTLTPTPPTLPCLVKDQLGPSSLPSPKSQSARVEVRVREGRAVNIHMFCARKPGLLLSTMRALDNLGLDIQQAVVSCFNGFALDIFRAEQCREGQDALPEQIKAVLLDSAGFQDVI